MEVSKGHMITQSYKRSLFLLTPNAGVIKLTELAERYAMNKISMNLLLFTFMYRDILCMKNTINV